MPGMIFRDKRGIGGEGFLWIFRIVGTVIIVGIMIFLLNGTVDKSLDINDLKFYAVAERFLYSKNCFAMIDTNRVYPGIIDSQRFTQESVSKCMESAENALGAKVTLYIGGEEKTVYYNQEYFEDILPLTFSNRFLHIKQRYLVLVDEERKPGNMLIEVAWQK